MKRYILQLADRRFEMSWDPDAKDCDINTSDEEGNTPLDLDGGTAVFDHDCNSVDDDLQEKLDLISGINSNRKTDT